MPLTTLSVLIHFKGPGTKSVSGVYFGFTSHPVVLPVPLPTLFQAGPGREPADQASGPAVVISRSSMGERSQSLCSTVALGTLRPEPLPHTSPFT